MNKNRCHCLNFFQLFAMLFYVCIIITFLFIPEVSIAEDLKNVNKAEYIEYTELPVDLQNFYKSKIDEIEKEKKEYDDRIKYLNENIVLIPSAFFGGTMEWVNIEDISEHTYCFAMNAILTGRIHQLWYRVLFLDAELTYTSNDYSKGSMGIMLGWNFFKSESKNEDFWYKLDDINTISKKDETLSYQYSKPCYYKSTDTITNFIYPFITYTYLMESIKSDEDADNDGEDDYKHASSHLFGIGICFEQLSTFSTSITYIIQGGLEYYKDRTSFSNDKVENGFTFYFATEIILGNIVAVFEFSDVRFLNSRIGYVFKL